VYTTNTLAFHLSVSTFHEPLSEMYLEGKPELAIFWDYLGIGCCVVIPAVVYFSLLGNTARNLESEELKKIEYNLKAIKSGEKAITSEERNYLLQYVSEVRKSIRAVSIIDYIVRFVLLTYLGIFL